MLINWINVSIYADNWSKLNVFIPQAERAINDIIERENVAGGPSSSNQIGSSRGMLGLPLSTSNTKSCKELIQSARAKIAAVSGLLKLHDKEYKGAAETFMTVRFYIVNLIV